MPTAKAKTKTSSFSFPRPGQTGPRFFSLLFVAAGPVSSELYYVRYFPSLTVCFAGSFQASFAAAGMGSEENASAKGPYHCSSDFHVVLIPDVT